MDEALREHGVVLGVHGHDEPQVFPLDIVPRVLPAEEWARISAGIEQRGRALELFLRDVYGPREIVAAGVVSDEMLDRTPGFEGSGRAVPPGVMRSPICGVDLVSTAPGEWVVLEDNLRMAGGMGISRAVRARLAEAFPEFGADSGLWSPEDAMPMLRATLEACAPDRGGDAAGSEGDGAGRDADAAVRIAVVAAPGEWEAYDLRAAAEGIGADFVTADMLAVEKGMLYTHMDTGRERVDVLYLRLDAEELLDSDGHDGRPLRHPLLESMAAREVAVVNAPGNGVADDKAIYALVPRLIDFYLGEPPLLDQVGTYLCAEPEQLERVLDRLDELVIKPIDGYGGTGITVGPECTPDELEERRAELEAEPWRFVAQEVQRLSTLPTVADDGSGLVRRHVDMRAFALLRPDGAGGIRADAAPTALTRVAPEGTMVVNASSGGGGKDTWIHRG